MHKTQAFQPFRALQSAWEILMKAPLPMWVGGLILVVVESLGSGGGGGNFHIDDVEDLERFMWFLVPAFGIGLLLSVVVVAVTSWLKVGYYSGVENVMREGDFEFERLFKTEGRWLNVFLVHIFQIILTVAAMLPFLVAGLLAVGIGSSFDLSGGELAGLVALVCLFYVPVFIYFLLGFTLMPFAAALDADGPMAALSRSWALADGIRVQLFLMGLLHVALVIVGLCAFCVGVFASSIIGHVMWCEAYVQATREDMGGWWVNNRSKTPRAGGPDQASAAAGSAAADSTAEGSPRVVETQAYTPEPAPTQEPPADDSSDPSFDPSAWRKGPDIPPIEDESES